MTWLIFRKVLAGGGRVFMADIDVDTGMEAKEKLEKEHGMVKEDVKNKL